MSGLRFEHRDGIAVLTLDRPDRLNAIDDALLCGFDAVLGQLEGDTATRAVVVTGAGRAFSAGADLDELAALPDADAFSRFLQHFTAVLDRLEQLPAPSIAAIDGLALGGGLELALACDLRVASSSARLGVPEIKLGLLPGAGGTQRLPRLVPRAVATHMLLTGSPLSADDALHHGLVNELSGETPALEVAEALARELAAGAPLAHAAAKRLLHDGDTLPLAAGIEREREVVATLFASTDAREGVAAFRAKRPPTFQGR